MFAKYEISGSQFLFYFCLSFISGILINSFWLKSWLFIPALLILAILLFVFQKNKNPIIFIFLIAFSFGLARNYWAASYDPDLINNQVVGIVVGEPEQRERSSSFVLESEGRKILVITGKYVDIEECDKVEIKGEIERVGDEFYGFSAKKGIYLNSFYPQIEIIEKRECRSLFLAFKGKAAGFIGSGFSSPQSSILKAMLLGEKQKIPADWQDKLSSAGVRHITAVSGMHVAVIGIIFLNIALGFGFGKRKALIVGLMGIIFFVFMTGAHPSAIRAGIMGVVLMLAQFFGRMNRSFRVLVLAAFLMLLFNPFLLRYDIGFQLSFAAISGIIVFSSFFGKVFSFFPKTVKEITAVSFSAYVFIFPILGYYFKDVSLVFPLTNILILPILYWIMFLGIAFVFLSFFSGILAGLFVIPLWILLAYLINVVDFFSRFPWAAVRMTSGIFILYLILLYFLFQKKNEEENFYLQ